jgi:hypothetical protein
LSRHLAALQFDQKSQADSSGGSEFNLTKPLRNPGLTNDEAKLFGSHFDVPDR